MKPKLAIFTVLALSMSAASFSMAQEALPQLDLGSLTAPERSFGNPRFVPGPSSIAQPEEFLDQLSVPVEHPPDLFQKLVKSATPSMELIDLGIRNLSQEPDDDLGAVLSDIAERLEQTPEDWLRRGIIKQFVDGDNLAAMDSYLTAARGGSSLAALFSGRAYLRATGVDRDTGLAVELLKAAEAAESPEVEMLAKIELAEHYSGNYGAPPDFSLSQAYYLEAVEISSAAIPDYIDFLINDLKIDQGEDEVQENIARLGESGNASALFLKYLRGDNFEEIMSELLDNSTRSAAVARGDIYLLEGDIESAFSEYAGAADADPYARAQTGRLALENPDLNFGLSTEQALQALDQSARLGEPLALLERAKRFESPEDRYLGSLQAQEQDPTGRYAEDIRAIKGEICAVNQSDCPPVPVWFITNRLKEEEDRVEYANRIGEGLTAGIARTRIRTLQVDEPESRSFFERGFCFRYPASCRLDDLILDVGVPVISPVDASIQTFIRGLKQSADEAGKDQVIVYIHGFNNSFDVAAERLALLTDRGRLQAVPLLLSWASGGRMLVVRDDEGRLRSAYSNDLEVATQSCESFKQVLSAVIAGFGSENVHVLAHSMGTYLADMIFRGCGDSRSGLPPGSVKSVVFAAADIDRDEFGQRYDDFRASTENFSLYVTANDSALRISSDIVHGKERLGQGGANRFIRDGTTTLDSTDLESGGLDHAHVFDVPEVRTDVAHVLKGRFSTGDPRCLTPDLSGAYLLSAFAC